MLEGNALLELTARFLILYLCFALTMRIVMTGLRFLEGKD